MKAGAKASVGIPAGIAVGVAALALGWAAYAQQVWEDFLIVYRSSKNLAQGHGLVYTVGEHLQTFTSPLQTLIPAALAWLTHCRSDSLVLWLFRGLGSLALGGGAVFLWRLARCCQWGAAATVACLGLYVFDAKSLGFTASGMETPYLLFFMAWQAYVLVAGGSPVALGLAWAGMMYSRPDACIQIATSYAALLVFRPTGENRRALVMRALKAGLVTTIVYLPWFAWLWVYYGTPVPNTITAKGLDSPAGLGPVLHAIWQAPFLVVVNGEFVRNVFAPTYVELGGPHEWGLDLNGFWRLLAYPVWLYWLYPRGGRWGRTFSLWFFLASIYYMCAPKCPWYVPPYALVGMIAWGFMIAELAPRLAVRREGVPPPAVSPSLVLLGGVILAVGLQARTCLQMAARDRLHQSIIEDRVRRPVGLWLHQHAQPKDTVFLEPLGYLGYYSNLKVYDFPGLASREVVTARRTLGTNNYDALIKALRPDWLVLRPREVITIRAASPGLLSEGGPGIYNLVQFFDQAEAVGALAGLPGVSTLRYDQTFLIYQRAH